VMFNMKEIRKNKLNGQSHELPETSGIIGFYKEQRMIYCRMSGNISAYISRHFDEDIENINLGEMIDECDSIRFQETETIFDALLLEKLWKYDNQPEFNKRYRDYDSYQYLGLNFVKYPFLKMQNDTIEDYFYIGPFRDPYLVHDAIDILSRVFQTPVCAAGEMPCDLLENEQCKGYCVQNKELLGTDLVRYYLLPEQRDMVILDELKKKLMQELNFKRADELSNYQQRLQHFHGQITFLAVTKWLNLKFEYKGKQIIIEKGLLKQDGKQEYFIAGMEYQINEQYAVDKSELDERWVVFNYVKKLFPEELIIAYEKNREKLAGYLTSKEDKGKDERED